MSDLLNLNIDTDNWLIAQNTKDSQLLKNPLLQKDVWLTIEDLGLKVNEHGRLLTIKFKSIKQDWLKLIVKLYILVRSQRKLSIAYLSHDVYHLNKLSQFLQQNSVSEPEQINNYLFEEFDYYLRLLKLSDRSISLHYMTLSRRLQ